MGWGQERNNQLCPRIVVGRHPVHEIIGERGGSGDGKRHWGEIEGPQGAVGADSTQGSLRK